MMHLMHWLRAMNDCWDRVTFSDLYAVPSRNGLSIPKATRGSGVPMLGMSELFGSDIIRSVRGWENVPVSTTEFERFSLHPKDLMFGRRSLTRAGAGKISIVAKSVGEAVFESSLIRVRLDGRRACPEFYFHYFRSPLGRANIERIVEQVSVAGIRSSELSRLHVPAPPLEEQERIAGVLGAFDDLIETNRRLADHLDDLRRAKVGHALAASSATTRLSEIAAFVNGRNFTKDADGIGRPVIRTPEARSGPGGNTVWSSVEADNDRVARAGDTLFVWSGTLMVNRWLYTDGLVNQHVFKVMPNQVPDWYVFALIEAQLPWFLGLAKDKATTMGHIKRAHLDEPMTGLDPATIARLNPVVEPIWSAALELRIEVQELARQRDELLPLLMSGRTRVRDLEAVT